MSDFWVGVVVGMAGLIIVLFVVALIAGSAMAVRKRRTSDVR